MCRNYLVLLVCVFHASVALAQPLVSSASVLNRAPAASDGAPTYQQDMRWLDPTGRALVMRDLGGGRVAWIAEEPAARVIDEIGGVRPAAAYGNIRLTSAYTGPAFNVVNTVTNVTANIGFLPDGSLDEGSLGSFCALAECRITRWFDQAGRGRDAVQNDVTAQPIVRLSHRTGKPLSIIWDFEATSGGPWRSLILPPALTIDSANMAILWTGRFHNTSLVSPLIELGVNADAFNFGYWDAHGDFYLGTRNHLMELPGHAGQNAAVGMISSSPAEGVVTNYHNRIVAQGKFPPEVHRGGLVGRTETYKQGGMMELSSLVLYDRGLTAIERHVAIKALGENFMIPQQHQDIYVADGDSLTQGIGTRYLQSYPWYMERLLARGPLIYNAAWAAKTMGGQGGLLNRYEEFTSKLHNPQGRRNVISLFAGTNDLQTGMDDKELFRLIQQYGVAARKTGFKMVIATIIPRATFTPKMEYYRNTINATIRSRWKEFADGVADLAAGPAFNGPGALTNGNVYAEDGIHLTDFGYQIVAAEMAAAVAPHLE